MDSQPLPKLYSRSLRPVLICQLCHTYGTPSPLLHVSLTINGCLPRSSCVNGCLPNTLLTCQDVPGSHSAFLCRVKGHTLTSCARRRGSLGTRLHWYTTLLQQTALRNVIMRPPQCFNNYVMFHHVHSLAYTHTFHHTSPILSLMYWKAQCINAMHHHYLLFIITYVCIHQPAIPPPLYVNTELIRAFVPAYNLQVNTHPLHIGTQCLIFVCQN